MSYEWGYPLEWLEDKLQSTNDPDVLRDYALTLARKHDSDTLQDLFQNEMEEDGYFEAS